MNRDNDLICPNLSVSSDGALCFAGQDTRLLAERYGTPLYLMDEDRIRERCRTWLSAVRRCFDGRARVSYASKAASFKRMYELINEEGMDADVVSPGEIYTAQRAGFPMERAFFHSNNKTDEDIRFAMDAGVGCFIADTTDELHAIERIAAERQRTQDLLLRITPGIDPHTYAAVNTGTVDSKFGIALETGQAMDAVREALTLPHIRLLGFHSHVGSQVFGSEVYTDSARVMLGFAAQVLRETGFETALLNIGGGCGVRYTAADPVTDIGAVVAAVAESMKLRAAELGIGLPVIGFEPGRSIAADAGMTLYTVGSVKRIPGYKTYVSVDGGMTDNIRYALYGAKYTVLPAARMFDARTARCNVVGRCCESGDIIQKNVPLPADIGRGDLLACLTTGAYHYSMASNYNRIPRPPVVMLAKGGSYTAVRRETVADLTALDV